MVMADDQNIILAFFNISENQITRKSIIVVQTFLENFKDYKFYVALLRTMMNTGTYLVSHPPLVLTLLLIDIFLTQ